MRGCNESGPINPVALVLSGNWTLVVSDVVLSPPYIQHVKTLEKRPIKKRWADELITEYPRVIGDIDRERQNGHELTRYGSKRAEHAWKERRVAV